MDKHNRRSEPRPCESRRRIVRRHDLSSWITESEWEEIREPANGEYNDHSDEEVAPVIIHIFDDNIGEEIEMGFDMRVEDNDDVREMIGHCHYVFGKMAEAELPEE